MAKPVDRTGSAGQAGGGAAMMTVVPGLAYARSRVGSELTAYCYSPKSRFWRDLAVGRDVGEGPTFHPDEPIGVPAANDGKGA
jgi:hypothetical protein